MHLKCPEHKCFPPKRIKDKKRRYNDKEIKYFFEIGERTGFVEYHFEFLSLISKKASHLVFHLSQEIVGIRKIFGILKIFFQLLDLIFQKKKFRIPTFLRKQRQFSGRASISKKIVNLVK